MKRNRKLIKIKKERVVLSDVLPFELPVTFSNRHFYKFLATNHIRVNRNIISWDKNDPQLELIIKLIFGFDKTKKVINRKLKIDFQDGEFKTIPFRYKISHKDKDFRELVIIHPKNQLAMIEFYEKYKEIILYYCRLSPFSIRKPYKVAKYTYHNDKVHIKRLAYDHEHKSAEEYDKEYENLKTFFTYKDISNVYKFYESYKYHRCEKKYNKLFKFDISKCFDSIYSHSLSWALLNKEIVKDNLKCSNSTFGGNFDLLMQNLNYGETNGIIIGPEFSRIFAELILQKIDLNVMHYLRDNLDNHAHGLKFKTDYEIFRYVDDFFVFYNDDKTKERIMNAYRFHLMEYKLYINDSKSALFEKPIITGLTIAKQKLADLLNENFTFEVSSKKKGTEEEEKKYSFYASSNKLITRFKTIIKETNTTYKDILNYTLACIDRKVFKLIKIYSSIENKKEYELKAVKSMLELLDFIFFIYSVSPRVNTTIKLCLILSKITKFTKLKCNFNMDNRHLVFKKIYDEISLVLWKNKNSGYTQVETLYLLIALKELGKEYRLNQSVLCKYFDVNIDTGVFGYDLNYFSITVLLFYIEDKKRYLDFKIILKERIKSKFEKNNKLKTTELTLLLLDLISCPYLDDAFKRQLLVFYDITEISEQNGILNRKELWFTKWIDFDFCKELDAKKSQEVY
ncbi:reverse transcriptase [Candidatus Termititenax persephonae]|uniref:Reverse transcriptase n=1 Tax=Candidatus Termititenax persephonae TaxID=2218525 RepID=A0A388TFN2_9BACT|nr:reverse transcriptase [Candidatus Termititenax persephonae]